MVSCVYCCYHPAISCHEENSVTYEHYHHRHVARLWNLCNISRTTVTYIVRHRANVPALPRWPKPSEDAIPAGHRWDDLEARSAPNRLKPTSSRSSTSAATARVFRKSLLTYNLLHQKPATLFTLLARSMLGWWRARRGAWRSLRRLRRTPMRRVWRQATSPRTVDSMVAVMRPTLDDIIQDPAAGAGGFLIAITATCASTATPIPGPRHSNAQVRRTPSTVWSTQDAHQLNAGERCAHGWIPTPMPLVSTTATRLGRRRRPVSKGATLIITNRPSALRRAANHAY